MDPLELAQKGEAEVCLGNVEWGRWGCAAWISKHALAGALDGHE